MRKRFFATVLALALSVATMVGCGSSADSAADTSGDTGPATYADEVDESTAEIAAPDDTSQGLADVAGENDDFGRPPEEDIVSWDEMGEGEEVVDEAPEVGEATGIIMLQSDYQSSAYAPSFVVSAVNPDTGDYHIVSSFVFEHVARINETEYLIEPGYKLVRYSSYRDMFNEDFSLMAANKTFLSNEEQHAGWVEQSGEFFDLTVALNEQSQSDFDTPKHYNSVGFTQDGSFVYADVDDWRHPIYYKVPLDNIVSGASYQLAEDDSYIMDTDYSESWRWARKCRVSSWIDDNRFLAVSYANDYPTCACVDVNGQSITEIVPSGSQTSWSPVIGPDGVSVAFLSAPSKGNDTPSIYLTDIAGNDTPTKLGTAYSPISSRVTDNGSIITGVSLAYCHSSILEWR